MRVDGIDCREVAKGLRLGEAETNAFADNLEEQFKPSRDLRIGKKLRVIDPPTRLGKHRFKLLHDWFQRSRLFHKSSHGGVRKRSTFSSARRHLGRRFVLTLDGSNCFPTVTPLAFKRELLAIGFAPAVAALLTKLCTVRNRIPQGSPVSNDALNLFFYRIDQRLASYCGTRNLGYSRVVDDFIVSGDKLEACQEAMKIVESELAARGIKVNEEKRIKAGLQERSLPQHVHSIKVNKSAGTEVIAEHKMTANQLAANVVEMCRSLQPSTLEIAGLRRRSLTGYLNYCRQAKFSPAKSVLRQMKIADKFARKALKDAGFVAYKNKWWLESTKRNEPRRLRRLWDRKLLLAAIGVTPPKRRRRRPATAVSI